MKAVMYANLHNHTTHSDGVFSPTELVKVAKDEGYGAVAATDHDTVTPYSEMLNASASEGLETVFGCEFYANCARYREYFADHHLVGFNFDPGHSDMKEYLRKRSADITETTEYLFEKAMKQDALPKGITWQEVLDYNKGISWICNDHVFAAMHAKGLVTETEWPYYFENYFALNGIEPRYPIMEIEDLISLIHDAGGIAVVAHPCISIQLSTVPELVAAGLDGLEVWHNGMVRHGYQREALRLALEYDLYISGGEDHSGLCGGQYKFFEDPSKTKYWVEHKTLGTTKEFFEEIRDMKKLPGREEIIKSYMEEYPEVEIPRI